MVTKITPQQAFEAAKVLHPSTTHIGRAGDTGWYALGPSERAEVDWLSGVDRWPMPEPKWRDATIEDFLAEREARFSDDGRDWHESTIAGISRTNEYAFESASEAWWKFCQCKAEADEAIPPYPGEGWRLLGQDEVICKGDEFFDFQDWCKTSNPGSKAGRFDFFYRRRFRPYTLVELAGMANRETSHGYIVTLCKDEVTFRKNDIHETRDFGDFEGITWADGSPFGVDE